MALLTTERQADAGRVRSRATVPDGACLGGAQVGGTPMPMISVNRVLSARFGTIARTRMARARR